MKKRQERARQDELDMMARHARMKRRRFRGTFADSDTESETGTGLTSTIKAMKAVTLASSGKSPASSEKSPASSEKTPAQLL